MKFAKKMLSHGAMKNFAKCCRSNYFVTRHKFYPKSNDMVNKFEFMYGNENNTKLGADKYFWAL
jgi:hypothetical protein